MKENQLRNKRLVLSMLLAVLFFCYPSGLLATNAAIIKIYTSNTENGALILDPANLYITKDTVVIWMNGISQEEVQVIFQDGKACQDVTISSREKGFGIDAKSCYVASLISYLSTSSLKFNDEGAFEYIVTTPNGKKATKGKIHVTLQGSPK
jgi:hypothetical protein